jgi:phage shock protein PspC (stress-responsive transcriptional regulator)
MKKAISINLGGIIFSIDEDAYMSLKKYLDAIEATFSDKVEALDVMRDIEARIAELLSERISNSMQVITIADIDEIKNIMGAPEDISDDQSSEEKKTYHFRTYRKMYRDPDDRIVAGVCRGIGAYWRIDPTIIRVLFILLTVFGFAGILLYLVLWIILPEAKTAAHKLEMRGEPVTLASIKEFMRNEFENIKRNFKTTSR